MKENLIAHFTDTHLGQRLVSDGAIAADKMQYLDAPGEHVENLRWVLDDIARRDISEVVFGGDIGNEDSVESFFEILGEYGFSISIVLGNHDRRRDVSQYINAGFDPIEGKLCSSRNDGHMKRIFLDSSENALGDRQIAWLAHELAGTAKAALFLHHPILAIDTPLERSGAALKDRREIVARLTGIDCDISVFCGHYHMADEVNEANIRQYTTPAVSYQVVKQPERIAIDARIFGYRILNLDNLETEVILQAASL